MKLLVKRTITLYNKIKWHKKCRISTSAYVRDKCVFEGANSIGGGTVCYRSQLGYGSYIGNFGNFSSVRIGRFCSIGNNVKVIASSHPTVNVVSTSPLFYSTARKQTFVDQNKYNESLLTENGYQCEIANDVWIGDNVLIKGGVKVGNGAVIAMGAVVTKDIPPYAIVGGVPAKIIRFRYNEEEIKKLNEIEWYNRDLNWIRLHSQSFMDFSEFIKEVENENL